jgi:hypothetical protein
MGGQIAISLRHEIKLCFRYRQPGFHVFSMTRRWRVDVLTVYVLSIHRTSISRLSSLLKGGVDASTACGATLAHHRHASTPHGFILL